MTTLALPFVCVDERRGHPTVSLNVPHPDGRRIALETRCRTQQQADDLAALVARMLVGDGHQGRIRIATDAVAIRPWCALSETRISAFAGPVFWRQRWTIATLEVEAIEGGHGRWRWTVNVSGKAAVFCGGENTAVLAQEAAEREALGMARAP